MRYFVLTICCFLCFNISWGQEKKQSKSLKKQSALLGDWGGSRTWLNDKGIVAIPRITTFYQGMPSGDGSNTFEFGGKFDVKVNFDLGKMGIWNKFSLITHVEYNFGNTINNSGGTLFPQNTALLLPGMSGSGRFDFSSVYFQKVFGKRTVLLLGKINMVDIAQSTTFLGGSGIDTYQNIAFVAPPSGLVPPYLFGTILSIKAAHFNYTFMVYDPISVVNESGLIDPFEKGLTFFGSIEKPVTIANKKGAHSFKVVCSTLNGEDLNKYQDIPIPGQPGNPILIKDNRWYVAYSFNQYLVQNKTDPNKGWGVYGQVGFSDGNPTPLNWGLIFGLGGTSPIKNRNSDKWGIGYFQTSISNGIVNSLEFTQGLILDDEQGIEVFYNMSLTSWIKIGVDYQLINPVISNNKTAHFLGFRSRVLF